MQLDLHMQDSSFQLEKGCSEELCLLEFSLLGKANTFKRVHINQYLEKGCNEVFSLPESSVLGEGWCN